MDATPDTAATYTVGYLTEGRYLVLSGKVHGLLILPRNLERDVIAPRKTARHYRSVAVITEPHGP